VAFIALLSILSAGHRCSYGVLHPAERLEARALLRTICGTDRGACCWVQTPLPGRSRHEEPVSMIHNIPPASCRSSRLGRPWPSSCLGNSPLTRSPLGVGEGTSLFVGMRGCARLSTALPRSAGSRNTRSLRLHRPVGGVPYCRGASLRALPRLGEGQASNDHPSRNSRFSSGPIIAPDPASYLWHRRWDGWDRDPGWGITGASLLSFEPRRRRGQGDAQASKEVMCLCPVRRTSLPSRTHRGPTSPTAASNRYFYAKRLPRFRINSWTLRATAGYAG